MGRLTHAVDSMYPSRVRPATRRAALAADEDYGAPGEPNWRDIDWHRHVRRVEVGGQAINFVDIGAGEAPAVLFVHGLGGNWQNWLENLPAAARERRALALDLPGFGSSPMPVDSISISGYAACVDAFCESLGLGPVVLVGNSMGGFIGAELAISFPTRVERLVLAAAAGISITHLRRRPLLTTARYTTAVGALTASKSRELISRPRLRHFVLSVVARHPTRIAPDLLWEILQGAGQPGYVQALDALTSYDFRDRLPEIGCPVLLIWGDKDMLVPVADADEFERLIPDARKVVFEDTGHIPMIERPRTFNTCLSEFLATERERTRRERQAA